MNLKYILSEANINKIVSLLAIDNVTKQNAIDYSKQTGLDFFVFDTDYLRVLLYNFYKTEMIKRNDYITHKLRQLEAIVNNDLSRVGYTDKAGELNEFVNSYIMQNHFDVYTFVQNQHGKIVNTRVLFDQYLREYLPNPCLNERDFTYSNLIRMSSEDLKKYLFQFSSKNTANKKEIENAKSLMNAVDTINDLIKSHRININWIIPYINNSNSDNYTLEKITNTLQNFKYGN
jgi:hypothetical protein